ncbi:hypothetical protein D9M72_638140 [compost metagenome]
MQRSVPCGEMFDRHHMGRMQRSDEADAGIDAFIDQRFAGKPSHKHGAGAAVAFGAAFLGPCQPALQPQIIEQRCGRRDVGKRHLAVIEDEANAVVVLAFPVLEHAVHSC